MAWTTPRTWVATEVNTATQFNAHLRDNELILKTGRDDSGRVTDISSTTVANLAGANLTGVAKLLGGANTWTAGTNRFTGAASLRIPVGTDLWTGTKGVDARGVWVEGDYLHHIAQDLTQEWRYLGTLVGSPAGALAGSIWVEGGDLHYIDSNGEERYCIFAGTWSTQHTDALAVGGSLWLETYLHWIQEAGVLEKPGHADVVHTDHTDHTDASTHGDNGPHTDTSSHTDATYSPHTDQTNPHVDTETHVDIPSQPPGHADHYDGIHHADWDDGFGSHHYDHTDHTDHTDHGDHGDHADSGFHSDHNDHGDGTTHNDIATDQRPVVV